MALLRPCKTSAAYEALPEQRMQLDMGALRQRAEAAGYEIVLDARVMLLLRPAAGGVESTVYQGGRVLLKTTDEEAAAAAYDQLQPVLSS
ncbi:MAG: hypothetical protein ACPGQL_03930 [Thermoplasmatota archaeon]